MLTCFQLWLDLADRVIMHYLWKFILLAVRLSFFRNLFIFQGRNWSEKTITNNLYEREASTRQNQVNYVLSPDILWVANSSTPNTFLKRSTTLE